MAKQFVLDATHDLEIDSAALNLRFTENNTEFVSQKIEQRLKMFKGEWWLNPELGVPFYQEILKKNPDEARVRDLLLATTAQVPGVDSVLEFLVSFDRATRVFEATFTVRATTGEIVTGEVAV